jgi:hypothetical protein
MMITIHTGQILKPTPQTFDSVINDIPDMRFAFLDTNLGRSYPLQTPVTPCNVTFRTSRHSGKVKESFLVLLAFSLWYCAMQIDGNCAEQAGEESPGGERR